MPKIEGEYKHQVIKKEEQMDDKVVVIGDLINKIGQGTRNLEHIRVLKTMTDRCKKRFALSKSSNNQGNN